MSADHTLTFSAARIDLLKGVGLLVTIVSATLFAGKEWGSVTQQQAERPMLMDRRDREEDALRGDLKDVKEDMKQLRQMLFECNKP